MIYRFSLVLSRFSEQDIDEHADPDVSDVRVMHCMSPRHLVLSKYNSNSPIVVLSLLIPFKTLLLLQQYKTVIASITAESERRREFRSQVRAEASVRIFKFLCNESKSEDLPTGFMLSDFWSWNGMHLISICCNCFQTNKTGLIVHQTTRMHQQ